MDQVKELSTNQLTLAINDLIENVQDTFIKIMRQNNDHLHLAVNDLLEAWLEFSRRTVLDSEKLAQVQVAYWQEYLQLCKELNERLTDIVKTPHVENDTQEKEGILLHFIEKFSLLISQHVPIVLTAIFSNEEENKKIELYTRQFTEAFSQHNFINTYRVLYANLRSNKEVI